MATTVPIDWMFVTGGLDYLSATGSTFEVHRQSFPAGVIAGHLISRAIDDAARWAIARVCASVVTGTATGPSS